MASEAAGADVDTSAASLAEAIATREKEKGLPSSGLVATATEEETKDTSDAGQAEEAEAKEHADTPPVKNGKASSKAAPNAEWKNPDAIKRRLSELGVQEADESLVELIDRGYRSKELDRGSRKRFDDSAAEVKKIEAKYEAEKDYADRYRRLMADPKFTKFLTGAGAEADDDDAEEDDILAAETPEKRREILDRRFDRKYERKRREEQERDRQSADKDNARTREIVGWAEKHRSDLGEAVSDEDYENAARMAIDEMQDEGLNPKAALTEKGLIVRMNRALERIEREREETARKKESEESKREVVRSARASSPPGVRTQVEKVYATPQAKRMAEHLEKYPIKPD